MIRRVVTSLMIATLLSGCMGHNALSRRVLKFNLTATETRWPRELLFVGMWIIPVYLIAGVVDILVINSIEFWSGKNPLSGKRAVVDVPRSELDRIGIDGIDVAEIERLDETHANLYVQFESGDRVTFDVVREGDQFTIRYDGIEFYRGDIKL